MSGKLRRFEEKYISFSVVFLHWHVILKFLLHFERDLFICKIVQNTLAFYKFSIAISVTDTLNIVQSKAPAHLKHYANWPSGVREENVRTYMLVNFWKSDPFNMAIFMNDYI